MSACNLSFREMVCWILYLYILSYSIRQEYRGLWENLDKRLYISGLDSSREATNASFWAKVAIYACTTGRLKWLTLAVESGRIPADYFWPHVDMLISSFLVPTQPMHYIPECLVSLLQP